MEIKDLNFRYTQSSPVIIRDLNLTIQPGMFLTVLGENGSAKSTLIKLILGLLEPISGSIQSSFKNIGYVPQKKEHFNMHFPITVAELLTIHLGPGQEQAARTALEKLAISQVLTKRFGDLSGGQQQRVLIARAISGQPDLLILDEPLTGIDEGSQKVIRQLLLDLNAQGLTIISIEHDIAFALHHSSHILTMKDGAMAFYDVASYKDHLGHEDLDNLLYHEKEHHHV